MDVVKTAQSPTGAASRLDVTPLVARMGAARARSLGFPRARDIDYSSLAELHTGLINNNGDPGTAGRWPAHTHDVERDVVATMSSLFGATPASRWGYVSGGGATEGVLHGMWLGRERFPTARLYYSRAAHYSTAKAARLLGMNASVIPTDAGGAMDLDSLAAAVHAHRDRPALVVATLGTTMTEALDDIVGIHSVLNAAWISDRHIMVDAALSGLGLAAGGGPTADLLCPDTTLGADSVAMSTHKSLGTPHVGGIVLARRDHVARITRPVDYVDSLDTTIGGSRSGHTAVEVAHALAVIGGPQQLRARTENARTVAAYALDRLRAIGWPAWRHDHAWTVVLDPPPDHVAVRWAVPISNDAAHIVCPPGVDHALIDTFVTDLQAADQASNETDYAADHVTDHAATTLEQQP